MTAVSLTAARHAILVHAIDYAEVTCPGFSAAGSVSRRIVRAHQRKRADTICEKSDVQLMCHDRHPLVDRRTQLMAIRSNGFHRPGYQ